ncbi:MAG: TolC family protein [Terriglobia bacterium]|jgi:outer membrane protein TolC
MVTKTAFWRLLATVVLLILFFTGPAACQEAPGTPARGDVTQIDFANNPSSFPNPLTPYFTRFVPDPKMDNSQRLKNLIVSGKLLLTLDDAIALALENNLDITVARYNLPIAQTDLLRAKGGGATRGVAGSFQSTTLFSGSLGGGVGNGGNSGGGGAGGTLGGTSINSVGAGGSLDPSLYAFYGGTVATTPLNYTVVSGVPVETSHFAAFQAGYNQGFVTGTSFGVSEFSYRLADNTTTSLFNPEFVSGLSVGFSQNLLNGFGSRANARFIRIGRNNLKYSMSVFRQSVITGVAAVMSTYYDLLADEESIRVAQESLGYAQKLLESNQAELKIGAVAQYDVLRSQEEVANQQQALLVAQNTFSQDAQSLKAKISKSFNEELATVEITPTDKLPEPHPDDVPALAEAMREAAGHRPEIEQADLNLRNQEYTIEGTRNALLPSVQVFATYSFAGLGGALRPTFANVLNDSYPNISYGVQVGIPFRNRQAQADAARALLEQRQLQMKLQDAKNQAVWDVSKAVSAVQQARATLDATLKLAAVSRQVLDMQQQKFVLASATVEDVITAQRNLATAEGNVVRDRAAYAKALIQFEQATGTLLDRNNISLDEAVEGDVHRAPNIPGTRQTAP